MTRMLVVQLCRLGDLLQTTPMLRGLRRSHPAASITLMVLDGFSHTPIPATCTTSSPYSLWMRWRQPW